MCLTWLLFLSADFLSRLAEFDFFFECFLFGDVFRFVERSGDRLCFEDSFVSRLTIRSFDVRLRIILIGRRDLEMTFRRSLCVDV